MTFDALCLALSFTLRFKIFTACHGIQVLWVHAQSIVANVMHIKAFWHLSFECNVCSFVSPQRFAFNSN